MKIVNADQMREIESRATQLGVSIPQLMENAGLAVAQEIREWTGSVEGQAILVLVGPGNNGGDGLVAARHLHDWGARVQLYIFGRKLEGDANLDLVLERGVPWVSQADDSDLAHLRELLAQADLVVDALLGTGKARPIKSPLTGVLDRLKEARGERPTLRLVALDLPTGLNPDSGEVDPACVAADLTVTLGYPKLGLFSFPGAAYLGKLAISDIGIPPECADDVAVELITPDWVRSVLPQRPLDAHKGTFGRVLVVAGSRNYVGASYLATAAVLRVGAGLATLATPEGVHPLVASRLTEATYLPLPEAGPGILSAEAAELVRSELSRYQVLILGCGLGQRAATLWFVQRLLSSTLPVPTVVDADGLNALTKVADWWKMLPHEAVLTPHVGEMARLAGLEVAEVSASRLAVAKDKAQEWDKVVLLKGAHTVVASPDGRLRISPWANPGLASGGTGDVLTGVVGGLMAQGLGPFDAAAAGVYLHGLAGQKVRDELGDAGMLAGDLLLALPRAIRAVKAA
jgi:NAD(P)H-hydrate epimerase